MTPFTDRGCDSLPTAMFRQRPYLGYLLRTWVHIGNANGSLKLDGVPSLILGDRVTT